MQGPCMSRAPARSTRCMAKAHADCTVSWTHVQAKVGKLLKLWALEGVYTPEQVSALERGVAVSSSGRAFLSPSVSHTDASAQVGGGVRPGSCMMSSCILPKQRRHGLVMSPCKCWPVQKCQPHPHPHPLHITSHHTHIRQAAPCCAGSRAWHGGRCSGQWPLQRHPFGNAHGRRRCCTAQPGATRASGCTAAVPG